MIPKIFSYIKKYLHWIVTGSTTILLAACYGTLVEEDGMCQTTYQTFVTQNINGNPIKGLEYTYTYANSPEIFHTDENGLGYIHFCEEDVIDIPLEIKDIDGSENGGEFLPKTIDFNTETYSDMEILEITMKENIEGNDSQPN